MRRYPRDERLFLRNRVLCAERLVLHSPTKSTGNSISNDNCRSADVYERSKSLMYRSRRYSIYCESTCPTNGIMRAKSS